MSKEADRYPIALDTIQEQAIEIHGLKKLVKTYSMDRVKRKKEIKRLRKQNLTMRLGLEIVRDFPSSTEDEKWLALKAADALKESNEIQ